MNETELFQLMIVNAIEKAIQPLREDLKQIKALNAKLLKEQREFLQATPVLTETPTFRPIGKPTYQVNETVQQPHISKVAEEAKMGALLQQAAPFVALQSTGELPDIDIPIEMFLKRR